jgi:hypothetical protein
MDQRRGKEEIALVVPRQMRRLVRMAMCRPQIVGLEAVLAVVNVSQVI